MTGTAVNDGVGARQREAVVVLFDIFDGNLPAPNRMAFLAVSSQLAPMNVSVTVLATLADICEYHFYVTGIASHSSMHAAQRITRLTVIELRNCPDWSPAIRGMAILAGNRQVAVRTMSAFRGLRSCASHKSGECKNNCKNKFGCNPSTHDVPLAFVLFSPGIRKPCRDKPNIVLGNSQSKSNVEFKSSARS